MKFLGFYNVVLVAHYASLASATVVGIVGYNLAQTNRFSFMNLLQHSYVRKTNKTQIRIIIKFSSKKMKTVGAQRFRYSKFVEINIGSKKDITFRQLSYKKRDEDGEESNQRIAGRSGDTALIFLISGHFDVSTISPFLSPGVLHQPVVLALFSSISNRKNTMI